MKTGAKKIECEFAGGAWVVRKVGNKTWHQMPGNHAATAGLVSIETSAILWARLAGVTGYVDVVVREPA